MAEAVRLVIWGLNETFWERYAFRGRHRLQSANHDIVIALAKRGIVSADLLQKRHGKSQGRSRRERHLGLFRLSEHRLESKGPRIKALIEDIELRPETVLFIDDNPLNLQEAKHFVPGLQVAGVDVIPTILASPLFKGKNDEALSRLNQYRLLETRKADEAVASDNTEFLRSCNIQVEIERDIEANIDRALELIKRTNQLNFTKKRLPERSRKGARRVEGTAGAFRDPGRACAGDRPLWRLRLLRFYLTTTRRGKAKLRHFGFSSCILNMGVERWLDARLGRPRMRAKGEGLKDLSDETPVDWISLVSDASRGAEAKADKAKHGYLFTAPAPSYLLRTISRWTLDETIGEFTDVRTPSRSAPIIL